MDIKSLKQQGQRVITPQTQRLAGIFLLAQAALVLIVNLINFIIEKQMDTAGGLAGLSTRQVLETVRTTVLFAGSLALPFWSVGFLRVAMASARGEQPQTPMLLAGFQRFFPLLRLMLLRFGVFFGLSMLASYGATALYMLSPASDRVMAQIDSLLQQGEAALTEQALTDLAVQMWPMYLIMAAAMGALLIPAFYRLRLAEYTILDGENRALMAMRESKLRSYCNKFWLFKLDLSFWWYYLATAVASLIVYLDIFLPKWGIAVNADAAYWLCLLVSTALQTAIGYYGLPKLQTTYALAYDALAPQTQQ